MFVVYTTEENLIRLCSEKDNSWYKIIMNIKEVVVRTVSSNEVWDKSNNQLQILHRAGVRICVDNEFIENISNQHPECVLEDPCAAYLLNINIEKAKEIQNKYGVLCQPFDSAKNILIVKGWRIDTADQSKPKSWDFFYSNHNCPLNSIVLVDRYFFSSNGGETLDDSFENLRQILDALLPKHSLGSILQVAIIFDYSTFNHSKDKKADGSDYEFKTLAERVNKIKRTVRDYPYDLELLSVNSDCYLYEETHNRRVVSNYSVTYAEHKLKAFRVPDKSLCNQHITFQRLFEEGLDYNDKSSTPEFSQKNILKTLADVIDVSKNCIDYACNGQVSAKGKFEVKNRMLIKR